MPAASVTPVRASEIGLRPRTVSLGTTSMVSLAYGVGMMLALTRQRPRTELESMNASSAQSYA